MSKKSIYRVIFANQEAIYEIYAQKISEGDIFGFIEVEEFVFGENTSLVVDPSEERLKIEFNNVKRTFIPMHSIIRMDEVSKQGIGKVRDRSKDDNKISMFPLPEKGFRKE